ncbi:Lar family restriction alleviation protein [Enterobacter hormaechei subsp. xiangfangensis]|uniref:Lar family restriction alleviation protein n=1 Tax=Enterobacter TaxID=547 RepID=UPI000F827D9A|nr:MULTISPECIES: Lar family restriction alleviation protein [Enterobacter]MBY0608550.1 Lar family restriction alleviation protein [Enterobacter sp. TF2-1-2]MBY0624783.1 Lar family restriction alleviation protein [Enterobacter sp. TF5]MCM7642539.1 Lar family restriction alleviation protein [Enterobacter hormaechei]MCM8083912.1 Lar family restriction alleviation protein [Enterobacter hormaechei]MCO7426960.1 Lar family restriction alleviation protein [Enterobacter hormaechei]
MSTLTKEWLQLRIAELEEERDATPGVVNEDAAMALAAMKLALASLEAKPVSVNDDMAYAFHHAISDSSLGSDEVEEIKAGLRAAFANVTAPPAPVSVPDENGLLPCPFCGGRPEEDAGGCSEYNGHEHQDYSINCKSCGAEVYCAVGSFEKADIPCSCHHNAREVCVEKWNRRAAMLQGADGNSLVIPDGLRLALSNAGIAAPESDEMLGATLEKYIQALVTWVKDRKPFQPAAPDFREISNSSTKHFRENAETSTKCWCRTCRPVTFADSHFVVCPECGNKRCPHANDHRHACTGSNEPGQEGSAYPAAPQQEVK